MQFYHHNLLNLSQNNPKLEEIILLVTGQTIQELEKEYEHSSLYQGLVLELNDFSSQLAEVFISNVVDIQLIHEKVEKVLNEKLHSILNPYRDLIKDTHLLIENLKLQMVSQSLIKLEKPISIYNDMAKFQNEHHTYIEIFPVAVKEFLNTIKHSLCCLEKMLERFSSDLEEIETTFKVNDLEVILIHLEQGDFHEFGENVSIFEFKEIKLVYKDRNSLVDNVFENIVNVLKNKQYRMEIGIPKRIARDTYTWYEFISFVDCEITSEVKRYYRNIGGLLGVLFCTNSGDIHQENLLAQKTIPYLIDSECMFSSRVDFDNVLSGTVLDTHLLPTLVGNPDERSICGIGFNKLYRGNIPFKQLENVSREYLKNEIFKGYRETVDAMLTNVDTIGNLIDESIYTVREVYRATGFYGKILHIISHPRYLNNWLDRKLLLSVLLQTDNLPNWVVQREIECLNAGRIPIFYHTHYKGDKISRNALKKLTLLNDSTEKRYQESVLKLSLDYLFGKTHYENSFLLNDNVIIDYLLSTRKKVFKRNGKYFLLNLEDCRGSAKLLSVMGNDLYSGKGGHLFLLICIYIKRPHAKLKKEIDDYYAELYLEFVKKKELTIGVYDGDASILYLTHLMIQYMGENHQYNTELMVILKRFSTDYSLEQETKMDVISGIAGFLIVLMRIQKYESNEIVQELTIKSVQKLLNSCLTQVKGELTWEKGYTGFSHGNAGIIYALALFQTNYPDPKIHKVILEALLYEKKNRNQQGWIDGRSQNKQEDFNSWCHGALGIEISRNAILEECSNLDDTIITILKEDLQYAKKTKSLRRFHINNSLCHGKFGYFFHEENSNALTHLLSKGIHIDADDLYMNKSLMQGELGAYYTHLFLNCLGMPNILLLT
ncbi:DUF4135 domain-containing protein [Bacillus cereus]|uniref:Lantibiotic biosynthesis protein dehydration domain-containing protein n=1 Tax=Bacillus cereus TaxID=1396 RepID=A0A9X7G5N1_BACCE|nr:DUF4135 domain-containing protein [Bacillus cereus]PED43150.1 hypothetical protein CON26_15920 [Bacillus cereus]PFV02855.1 hypothetical protein COK98_25855 [Bacillus cereus]